MREDEEAERLLRVHYLSFELITFLNDAAVSFHYAKLSNPTTFGGQIQAEPWKKPHRIFFFLPSAPISAAQDRPGSYK